MIIRSQTFNLGEKFNLYILTILHFLSKLRSMSSVKPHFLSKAWGQTFPRQEMYRGIVTRAIIVETPRQFFPDSILVWMLRELNNLGIQIKEEAVLC